MGSITDQARAALLIVATVLTAGMFAGFAFGATSSDVTRRTAPLLLQSATVVRHTESECQRTAPVRQARATDRTSRPAAPAKRGV